MWMARRRLHFSRAAEAIENDELRDLRASRGVAGGEAGGEPNLLEGCVPRPAADAAQERRRRAAAAAAAAAADDAAAAGSESLEELGRREAHARVAVCEPEQCEEEDGEAAPRCCPDDGCGGSADAKRTRRWRATSCGNALPWAS